MPADVRLESALTKCRLAHEVAIFCAWRLFVLKVPSAAREPSTHMESDIRRYFGMLDRAIGSSGSSPCADEFAGLGIRHVYLAGLGRGADASHRSLCHSMCCLLACAVRIRCAIDSWMNELCYGGVASRWLRNIDSGIFALLRQNGNRAGMAMASLHRVNQDDLRNHNLSVVIDTLLRASLPMSRADLAEETGLTKLTMSLLVSLLIDAGIVKEGEPQDSSSYGRPSTPLVLGGGKVCGIGMQVNTDGYGCVALDIDRGTLGGRMGRRRYGRGGPGGCVRRARCHGRDDGASPGGRRAHHQAWPARCPVLSRPNGSCSRPAILVGRTSI